MDVTTGWAIVGWLCVVILAGAVWQCHRGLEQVLDDQELRRQALRESFLELLRKRDEELEEER